MKRAVAAALVVFALAPPPYVVDCSRPEYRADHLALCNMSSEPPPRGGGGRRGLLGLGIGPL